MGSSLWGHKRVGHDLVTKQQHKYTLHGHLLLIFKSNRTQEAFGTDSVQDPWEEGMATHSCILAWRIPWTEEPVEL